MVRIEKIDKFPICKHTRRVSRATSFYCVSILEGFIFSSLVNFWALFCEDEWLLKIKSACIAARGLFQYSVNVD